MVALAQAARDDAHHARVPALPGGPDQRPRLAPRLDLGDGLGLHLRLDGAARAVVVLQHGGDALRLLSVVGREQPCAHVRAADPARRVDPRPQHVAAVERAGRRLQPRHVAQRAQPRVAAVGHDLEALQHEGAVEPRQRGDVRHRRQRHQIQQRQQLGLLGARRAQRPVGRDQQQERHPRRTERALPGRVVGAVGVHHGQHVRQVARREVVVHDHHVRASFGRHSQRAGGRGAAVEADHEVRRLAQSPHGRVVGAVALGHAVGDVDHRLHALRPQPAGHQRRRGRPVHVVIAEQRHALALADRRRQPLRRRIHVRQRRGVGHRVAQGGREMRARLVQRHAAGGQHAPHQLGHRMALRDRERRALHARVGHHPLAARQRQARGRQRLSRG